MPSSRPIAFCRPCFFCFAFNVKSPSLFSLALLGLCLPFAASADIHPWPQFRGPDGNGIASADDVPLRFSESENIAWKTSVPGKGWSSPVVTDKGKIWLSRKATIPDPWDQAAERYAVGSRHQGKVGIATGCRAFLPKAAPRRRRYLTR